MRRNEKEVTERSEIDDIIRRSRVCRLGLSDEGRPYVVPLCFGYDGEVLYFHCAREGRKLDILGDNSRVCVEFDIVERLVEAAEACAWGIRYESVIVFGRAVRVEDTAEKRKAMGLVMAQYSDRAFTFPEAALGRTAVVKVMIDTVTGKRSQPFADGGPGART